MNLLKHLTNIFKKKEVPEDDSLPTPLPVEKEEAVEIQSQEKPKKVNQHYKFSEQEKQLIVSWHAMGHSPSEIQEKVREELNASVATMTIHQYTQAAKWQPLIKKVREETMQDLASVSGSHKKVRLQRHEKIYDKAIGKNKFDLALKATEAQRKEMEEGNVTLTLNQFNVLSDDELEHKKNEVMKRIQLLSQKGGVIDVISTNKTETVGP